MFWQLEDSPLNPGMGSNSGLNHYFASDIVGLNTGAWTYKPYDMNESYLVPVADVLDDSGAPFQGPFAGLA